MVAARLVVLMVVYSVQDLLAMVECFWLGWWLSNRSLSWVALVISALIRPV